MKTPAKVALVLLVFFGLAGLACVALWAIVQGGGGSVADKTVLEIDFDQEFIEALPEDPIGALLGEDKLRLIDVLAALDAAAKDDRVVGLVARISGPPLGIANLQELRDAVTEFRASGKKTVAYADSFGEFTGGNGAYFLASAFEEVYIQPSGDVGWTGLAAVSPFIRGALDKLGVTAEFGQRYEYKNAVNLFTEKEFTEPHEEALRAYVDSVFDQMVAGIAASRELTPERVRELADRGPTLGPEAVSSGLIDGLKYRDQVYDRIEELAGADAAYLDLGDYAELAEDPWSKGDLIAVVYGLGGVTRGENDFDPLSGAPSMGGDAVARALRKAAEDDDVRAILFRVDSPGGSYIGSDTVWREVDRISSEGKPVIVSMGDVAGSGGYFVAMAADKIVAQPGTVTGSIGVFAGKFATEAMWAKIGVTWDEFSTSDNAAMLSSPKGFTDSQRAKLEAELDRIYADFTEKAAAGRGMPVEKLREVAKGRIWSGEDARELGLVDELGGYRKAIELARTAAGLAPDAPVRLRQYPAPKTPFELLFDRKSKAGHDAALRAAALQALESVRPFARAARQMGLIGPEPGELAMPWVPEVR